MKKKYRVLIVTRNFPPLTGGMEKLLFHIFKELSLRYDTWLTGPAGCEKHIDSCSVSSFPVSPLPLFLISCLRQTIKSVKKFKPQLILSGSGVTAPIALLAGKLFKIPVVTYLHGLDIAVKNLGYQMLFVPLIRACDGAIVNSSFTADLAEKNGIQKRKINILNPGAAIPLYPVRQKDYNKFREDLNAGSRPVILSVGRLTERKGIIEFIENCLDDLIEAIPDILFVVIGGEAKDAVNPSAGMEKKIKNLVKAKGCEKQVAMLGKVSDERLQQAYASSDLFVFPIIERPGDIEGFGMVAVEAAAYGLPTAAFAAGGVVDAVKNNVSGKLIESGKYHEFMEAIVSLLQKKNGTVTAEGCRSFARQFSWHIFGNKLSDICLKYLKKS